MEPGVRCVDLNKWVHIGSLDNLAEVSYDLL